MRRTLRAHLRSEPLVGVAIGLLLLYAVIVALRPEGTFWSLDEGGKFLYIQNTLRTGDAKVPLVYPGRNLDPNLEFVALFYYAQDGTQIYSWWPVGFPLLAAPFYRILGWAGLYVLPVLAGVIASLAAGLIARELRPEQEWAAPATALIVGLATPVAFYSTMFWEHTPATALAAMAVLLTVRGWRKGGVGLVLTAAVLVSGATLLRTDNISVAAAIGVVLLLRRWRWSLAYAAAYAAACVPWLLWNRDLMGGFLGRQWGGGAVSLNTPLFLGIQQVGAWLVPHSLFNSPKIQAYAIPQSVLAGATVFALVALAGALFKPTRVPALGAAFLVTVMCAAVLLEPEGYRSVHGFVLIAPHVLLVAWFYATTNGRRGIFGDILAACTLMYGLTVVSRGWDAAGGQQWGPRYLLSLYPLLVPATVVGASRIKALVTKYAGWTYAITLSLAVLVGIGFEVRGWQASYQTTHHYQQTAAALRPLMTQPVVTNCTWLPMVMPEFYWTGLIFDVQNEEELQNWQRQAAAAGVTSALQVEMDYCLSETLDHIRAMRAANPAGLRAKPVSVSTQQATFAQPERNK